MNQLIKNTCIIAIVGSLALVTGCGGKDAKKEAQIESIPVNCATAEGDIRMLKSEKESAAQQAAAGISTISPIGLIAGFATGTEGAKAKMATGEYNDMIDKKIAEIKQTCNLP
jgi:hypothetical protein